MNEFTLFEIDGTTGTVRVLSPAGLVVAELDQLAQAQILHTVLSMALARAAGQPVPARFDIKAPAMAPTLTTVKG